MAAVGIGRIVPLQATAVDRLKEKSFEGLRNLKIDGASSAHCVRLPSKSNFVSRQNKLAVKLTGVTRKSIHAAVDTPGLADEQNQGQRGDSDFPAVPSGRMMVPVMKKGFGAYGGGATLEKSKLDLSSAQTKMSPQIDLGGGGGNTGKGNSHGGGDGGDDGGDDDDYFGEDGDDDGDGNDGFLRRILISEVFDRASVEAVLQEWFKTMADLPAGLCRAVEMGLVSSAQVARFMSIDARPTIARIVSRLAPSEVSRAFIGRMMADPGFIFKFVFEQCVTVGAAASWEIKQRGDRIKDEWDIALTNVLTLALCNAAAVWCLSPSRSYGTTARSSWQMALQKLPNNMFDKSYPLMEFTKASRAGSFFYQALKLSAIGAAVGSAGGVVSNALLEARKKRDPEFTPSVAVPSLATSTAAYAGYLGLSGSLRYQLIYGADRALQQYFTHIPMAILSSSALRCGNVYLGEPSRLMLLGLDREAQQQAQASAQAFRRTNAGTASSDQAAQSGFPFQALLAGIPFLQGGQKTQKNQQAGRRKKVVRRAITTKKAVEEAPVTSSSAAESAAPKKRKVKRKVALAQ